MVYDYFQNKKVLVTGAAGFLGSHLVENLLKNSAQVVGVDNLLTGKKRNLEHLSDPKFTFIQADVIENPDSYLPSNFVPDLIFHFASPASPPAYQKYPVQTYLVNSIGTHKLLQFLKAHNPDGRFIYAGTSEAYGDPLEHPQKETYFGNVNPNGIRSCYDEGKRLGETICGVHFRDLGIDTRIGRIFNTYGPRLDPDDGRVISNFLKQAILNQPFSVYGDGSQTRSYCYVDDLIDGFLKFAQADHLSGQTINIGNPGEYTVLQTAEVIATLTNRPMTINHLSTPGDDPTRRQPDISKAKQLLNWQPKVSLEEGLIPTIKWYESVLK